MSFFSLTITGGDNEIKLDKQISGINVWMDTINDHVMTKSNGMLAKLTIIGKITEKDTAQYIELFKWAKDFKSKTQYRSVSIKIAEGEDDDAVYRTYEFGQMFVVDYKENYTENTSNGSQTGNFELLLTQKDDCWDTVNTFSK